MRTQEAKGVPTTLRSLLGNEPLRSITGRQESAAHVAARDIKAYLDIPAAA